MAKPDKCISVNEAKALQNNWETTREPAITAMRNGTQDMSDFMWSLDELQEYLDYVKQESKKAGCNNPGIRVFLGAYNDNNSTNTTVFFAPTETDQIGADNNYDIEPFNFGTGGWPPTKY